jgi:hypothetical protein
MVPLAFPFCVIFVVVAYRPGHQFPNLGKGFGVPEHTPLPSLPDARVWAGSL